MAERELAESQWTMSRQLRGGNSRAEVSACSSGFWEELRAEEGIWDRLILIIQSVRLRLLGFVKTTAAPKSGGEVAVAG